MIIKKFRAWRREIKASERAKGGLNLRSYGRSTQLVGGSSERDRVGTDFLERIQSIEVVGDELYVADAPSMGACHMKLRLHTVVWRNGGLLV